MDSPVYLILLEFSYQKSPDEVPIIDNYMGYLGCRLFIADKFKYKISIIGASGHFLYENSYKIKYVYRAVKSLNSMLSVSGTLKKI